MSDKTNNVLILAMTNMGQIRSTLFLLRQKLPGAGADVLLNERNGKEIGDFFPEHNLILGDAKSNFSIKMNTDIIKKIRGNKYDLCIALMNDVPPNRTSSLLLILTRARKKVFIKGEEPAVLNERWVRFILKDFFAHFVRRLKWSLPFIIFKAYLAGERILTGKAGRTEIKSILDSTSSPKILIFNYPPHVGNALVSSTLAKTLRKNFPRSRIDMVTGSNIKGLLESYRCINNVLYFDDDWIGGNIEHKSSNTYRRFSFISSLRKNKYDIAFDLSVNSWYGSMFAAFAGIRYRIGFVDKSYSRKYGSYFSMEIEDSRLDLEIEKPQSLQVNELAKAIGISDVVKDYLFDEEALIRERRDIIYRRIGIDRDRFLLGIHPGADWENKRWGVSCFAEVAKYFKNNWRASIIITGGIKEKGLCRELNSQLGPDDVVDLSGSQDLLDLAATISGLSLFLVNNTGPMHIAVAVNTPFVAITGPSPVSWNPVAESGCTIRAEVNCRPCDSKICDNPGGNICISEVAPEAVINAAVALLEGVDRLHKGGITV